MAFLRPGSFLTARRWSGGSWDRGGSPLGSPPPPNQYDGQVIVRGHGDGEWATLPRWSRPGPKRVLLSSERRIGAVLRERGGLPEGFVLATKVGPDPSSGDFSGGRVRRSAEESLDRLGLERFQLLYLHNPERVGFESAMAPGGPVDCWPKARAKLTSTATARRVQ